MPLSALVPFVDDPVTGERWIQDQATGDWFIVDYERISELHASGALAAMPPLQQELVGYLCAGESA